MSSPGPLCSLTNPQVVNDGTLMLWAVSSPTSVDAWDSFQLAFQSAYKSWIEAAGPSESSLVSVLWRRFSSGVSVLEVERSLAGREIDDAVAKAEAFLRNLIDRIKNAADWETLNKLAEPLLGQASLTAGLLYGICESLVGDVWNLLGLGKLIVLAGIYERIKHHGVSLVLDPVSMALAITVRAIPWLYEEARKCDEELWKILHELLEIAEHPIKFIESAGKNIWKGVVDDWNKLKAYNEDHSVSGDFQAGRLMGRALYQIIMMILLVLSVAGVMVKLAAKFPWLVRLARFIKSGGELAELEAAGDVAKGAEAAEGLSDAAQVSEKLKGLQAEGDARRAQSFKDIDAYEDKYAAKRDEALEAGQKKSAGGYKAKVTEAIGERTTTEYMQTEYPDYVLQEGFKPGTGFDQLYVKYNAAGDPEEFMIVEAKGPGAVLSDSAKKGPQMSQEWVENTVKEMSKSSDADTKALGQQLQDALDDGTPPVTGKVVQAVPDVDPATSVPKIDPATNQPTYSGEEVPLPDSYGYDGQYN